MLGVVPDSGDPISKRLWLSFRPTGEHRFFPCKKINAIYVQNQPNCERLIPSKHPDLAGIERSHTFT